MPKFGRLFIGKSVSPEAMVYNDVVGSWEFVSPLTPAATNEAKWSPKGDWIAMATASSLSLRNADAAGYPTTTWPSSPTGACQGVDFDPAGDFLASAYSNSPYLRVHNTASQAIVAGVPALPAAGWCVSYNHDGSRLAVVFGTAPYLRVYDTTTWTVVSGFPSFSSVWAYQARFSRAGTDEVLAVLTDNGIQFYDGVSGALRADLATISTDTYEFAWSPDGQRLAVGDTTSPPLRVLDLGTKNLVPGVYNPGLVGVTAVAWAHDGRLAIGISGSTRALILTASLDAVETVLAPTNTNPAKMAWAPAPPYILSGVVRDAADAPISRSLYAIHDASKVVVGQATSDAGTGAYSIATPYTDGHTVMLIEEDGRAQAIGTGVLPL